MSRPRPALVGLVFLLLLPGSVRGDPLRVFAAASLSEAFSEIGGRFEAAHPGTVVEFQFAGSQVLRTQIEQGALVDVFASADRVHADALRARRLLGETTVIARNSLVVVTPEEAPRIHELGDLARPGIRIVVAGPTVPAGRYTSQVVRMMAASGLFCDGFESRVRSNIVSQETNVRAVLAKVALGEADAGFVYRSDTVHQDSASNALRVRVIDIPERFNVIAEYPIGIPSGAKAPELADAFIRYVLGPEGRAILIRHGFSVGP